MFWAIWAAVGPVSREKKRVSILGIVVAKEDRRQPQGGPGGPRAQLRLMDRTGWGSQAVKSWAHSCFICNVQSCNGNGGANPC